MTVIKGTTANHEILKDWANNIKISTQPQLFPVINLIKIGSKTIVEIIVQEFPVKPVAYKGRYFKRVGASNHKITIEEIVEMQLYSINSSFDSFIVDTKLSDLNNTFISDFFIRLQKLGRLSLTNSNALNLNKLGLLKDSKATFASLLLFGNHTTGIHIGRFKAADVIIDDVLIKSPLFAALDEAMVVIKKNISVRFEFTGELQRTEKW
ncbi:MAG: ATP-dependent DNA helicase, partial [Deltaproteobacteria bacterium]|nr:ATP-dependent DNA helicase [Deltaproteobacteria bacterium]